MYLSTAEWNPFGTQFSAWLPSKIRVVGITWSVMNCCKEKCKTKAHFLNPRSYLVKNLDIKPENTKRCFLFHELSPWPCQLKKSPCCIWSPIKAPLRCEFFLIKILRELLVLRSHLRIKLSGGLGCLLNRFWTIITQLSCPFYWLFRSPFKLSAMRPCLLKNIVPRRNLPYIFWLPLRIILSLRCKMNMEQGLWFFLGQVSCQNKFWAAISSKIKLEGLHVLGFFVKMHYFPLNSFVWLWTLTLLYSTWSSAIRMVLN